MSTTPTVYIVDDNQDIIDSLCALIESVGYSIQKYNNATDFLNNYESHLPCCLVLDVRMPTMSGLELQETLNRRQIKIPIIFITGHGDIPMAVQAMKQGAVDFLTKPIRGQILLDSINSAIRVSSQTSDNSDKNAVFSKNANKLTDREREIMRLMVQGKLTKTIAEHLHISPNTVNVHRSNVMRKMGTRSLAELIGWALSNDVLSQQE